MTSEAQSRPPTLSGLLMTLYPLLMLLLPKDSRDKLAAKRQATLALEERKKQMLQSIRELEKEKDLYKRIIVETLANLGYMWRPAKNRDGNSPTKGAIKVQIERDAYNHLAFWYKVETRRRRLFRVTSELPYETTVKGLMDDDTLLELSYNCQRIVTAKRDNPQRGLWYVVHRNDYTALLPRIVRYSQVLPHYRPDMAGKCSIILGIGENNTLHEVALDDYTHVLIGGGSGSGKSNTLNNLISTIGRFSSPDDVAFVMIDPKRVELNFYEKLPHLRRPIVYDVETAIRLLDKIYAVVRRRTRIMQMAKVKKLSAYNAKHPDKKLPRLIIVVEELASLWQTAKQEKIVKRRLEQIANMGRAPGVHLILCTQLPIVQVVPSKIKVNMWLRIAGRTSSPVESQVILSTGDAAWLDAIPGRMIYAIDTYKHIIQTPLIRDEDVEEAVAIARGKHEGLIVYEQLQVTPQKTAILRRIVDSDLLNGILAPRRLQEYFAGYAIPPSAIKAILDEVIAAGEVQIGGVVYGVKRKDGQPYLVLLSEAEPIVVTEPPTPPPPPIPPSYQLWGPPVLLLPSGLPEIPVTPPPAAPPPAHDLPGIVERRATTVFKSDPAIRDAIHRLKDDPSGAEWLGHMLAAEYERSGWACTLIVPVPLSSEKLAARGFNQAALLAEVVAHETGLAYEPTRALKRYLDTVTQRGKNKEARLRNLEHAFSAAPAFVQGERILLIDDVATTGATLQYCAAALNRAGASAVYALVVASSYINREQIEESA